VSQTILTYPWSLAGYGCANEVYIVKRFSSIAHLPWSSLRTHLAVFVVYVVISLVLTYPLVTCLSTCARDSGDPLLNAWILAWDARKLGSGLQDFFSTNTFYPHLDTLAYTESQIANGLMALPVMLIRPNPMFAHNVLLLCTFVLCAFGTYLLTRRLTGSSWAGFVAGIIYAFCPYRMAHSQLQVMSMQWFPFTFLYLDKSLREHKWWHYPIFTAFFNLQALSSFYHALSLVVACLVLFVVYLWSMPRVIQLKRAVFSLSLCVVLTLLVSIPIMRPYFALSNMGFARSAEATRAFQASLTDFFTAPAENRLYGALTAPLRGVSWEEHALFLGVSVAVLVALGLVGAVRGRNGGEGWSGVIVPRSRLPLFWAYAVLAAVFFVLAMGISRQIPGTDLVVRLPFGWLFEYVPGFKGLRVPARFGVVTILGVSVLAGYGIAALSLWRRASGPKTQTFVAACFAAVIVAEYFSVPWTFTASVPVDVPPVYIWLADLDEDAIILELPFPMTDCGEPDYARYPFVEAWRVYYSAYHWKTLVNGYSGFLPHGYSQLMLDLAEFPDPIGMNRVHLYNVDYVVVHTDMFSTEDRTRFLRRLASWSSQLATVARFDETMVLSPTREGKLRAEESLTEASFADQMRLIGSAVSLEEVSSERSLRISILWRALADIGVDYTIFVHVLDSAGNIIAQGDAQPQLGDAPTSQWSSGDVIVDDHVIALSEDAMSDVVDIVVGVYDLSTMERLPLLLADGAYLDDKIFVGDIGLIPECWLRHH